MSIIKKLAAAKYWINKNTDEIAMRVEKNIHSTMMMNKAII